MRMMSGVFVVAFGFCGSAAKSDQVAHVNFASASGGFAALDSGLFAQKHDNGKSNNCYADTQQNSGLIQEFTPFVVRVLNALVSSLTVNPIDFALNNGAARC